jgi:hypothetical protein
VRLITDNTPGFAINNPDYSCRAHRPRRRVLRLPQTAKENGAAARNQAPRRLNVPQPCARFHRVHFCPPISPRLHGLSNSNKDEVAHALQMRQSEVLRYLSLLARRQIVPRGRRWGGPASPRFASSVLLLALLTVLANVGGSLRPAGRNATHLPRTSCEVFPCGLHAIPRPAVANQ